MQRFRYILISDLVVTNLIMHSLPGMILLRMSVINRALHLQTCVYLNAITADIAS